MVCYAAITKYLWVSADALLLLTDPEFSRFECLTSFTLKVWMISSLDTKGGASTSFVFNGMNPTEATGRA